MALHHLTKKSAVEKYSPLLKGGKSVEEITYEILADPKEFSAEDAQEIVEAIIAQNVPQETPQGTPPGAPPEVVIFPAPPAPTQKPTQQPSNAKVQVEGLEQFDYSNLQGENFTKYEEFVKKLQTTKMYVFEEYKVEPLKNKVSYQGFELGWADNGIRIKETAPLKTTKMEVRHVLNLNAQYKNGPNYRYYLLKKTI